MNRSLIRGAVEVPYVRRTELSTADLLAKAFFALMEDQSILPADIDGLGVSSFTVKPDRCVDIAWKLGLNIQWSMDDSNGGMATINMLQHAVAAIETGRAKNIVLLAGDSFKPADFVDLITNYNLTTRNHLKPLEIASPNSFFALLTKKHMAKHGLDRRDYGKIVVDQRSWAAKNPRAVYRSPMTIDDYISAQTVADPLCIYDCVPVVSGANAILVSDASSLASGPKGVRVKALASSYNFDGHEGDGLQTGMRSKSVELFAQAGISRDRIDVACIYDDYPVMTLVQLEDLGMFEAADIKSFIHDSKLPLNTSGGQLSVGQAGTAGGMHGLVEAITQLTGKAGARQLAKADHALVSGYGMIEYRYGMCANAAILEAVR